MAKKGKSPEKITFDYTNMLAGAVGARNGITEKRLEKIAPLAEQVHEIVTEERSGGRLPFMDLPYTMDLEEIRKFAAPASKKYENLVVLGIGGSALGMIALQTALNSPFHNLMDAKSRKAPRLFVEDNVDPERIANMLDVIDPAKTLFNVISKSGGTAETMSAFLIARNLIVKKLGAKKLKDHMVATTDVKVGYLRPIVEREGLASFVVPDGVGGRFSVLSAVGLLPAAIMGIDIKGLMDGAAQMDKRCRSGSIYKNPALMAAALHYLADTEKGKNIQVMMPYSNALKDMADWFRQLWAESLGKKYSLEGRVVHTGQTPAKSVGATDQHSQLQLYNEGPSDKTVTMLRVEEFRKKLVIPKGYGDLAGVAYLGGHEMGELLNAEQSATEMALTKNRCPNCTINLPSITPETVGQLIYMLEVQTAYAGLFYGINTFDQPGVEEGKISTYALMGRPGFEDRKKEIQKTEKSIRRKKI